MGSIKSYLTPTGHLDLKFRACLDIQATIECGFTLKRVRDMTRTYSQKLFTSNDDISLNMSTAGPNLQKAFFSEAARFS